MPAGVSGPEAEDAGAALVVEYRPFANVNSFIPHDGPAGAGRVRMSDLLEGAPAHEALAFIR